jgi:DNA-binding transcriptional regulator YhcF (GntR family)
MNTELKVETNEQIESVTLECHTSRLPNSQELLTIVELAEMYKVSTQTVRRWLADVELDPEGYKKNSAGSDSPLYSKSRLDVEMSKRNDLKHLNELSDLVQQLIKEGLVALSREQLEMQYIEEQTRHALQIEDYMHQIGRLQLSLNSAEEEVLFRGRVANNANNALEDALRELGDKRLSQEQIAWVNAREDGRRLEARIEGIEYATTHRRHAV